MIEIIVFYMIGLFVLLVFCVLGLVYFFKKFEEWNKLEIEKKKLENEKLRNDIKKG